MSDTLFLPSPGWSNGDVMLEGGDNDCEGRVCLRYNSQWWTVCKDGMFDQKDAEVICAQLGCG